MAPKLSPTQRKALRAMQVGPLAYFRATGSWSGFAGVTIRSLEICGFCRIEGKQRPRAVSTGAGRKALARSAGRSL